MTQIWIEGDCTRSLWSCLGLMLHCSCGCIQAALVWLIDVEVSRVGLWTVHPLAVVLVSDRLPYHFQRLRSDCTGSVVRCAAHCLACTCCLVALVGRSACVATLGIQTDRRWRSFLLG